MRILAADIGGTNARFALAGPDRKPVEERTLQVADFAGPAEAALAFLGSRRVWRTHSGGAVCLLRGER